MAKNPACTTYICQIELQFPYLKNESAIYFIELLLGLNGQKNARNRIKAQ
jgi:hypothetical protein